MGTNGRAIEWTYPRAHVPSNQQIWGSKSPLSSFSKTVGVRRECQQSTFESPSVGNGVMARTIAQLSPNPQMCELRSNTMRAVVERPEHHHGDDLVVSNNASFWVIPHRLCFGRSMSKTICWRAPYETIAWIMRFQCFLKFWKQVKRWLLPFWTRTMTFVHTFNYYLIAIWTFAKLWFLMT